MYREIYIDAVFVTNFLMDLVLLRLTGMLLGIRAVWYRSLLGAVIGSLSSCLILLISSIRYPAVVVFHVLTAAVMAKVGCQIRSRGMLARAAVTLYMLAFLCGGLWEVLSAGRRGTLRMFLLFTGVSYVFLALCVRGYRRWQTKGETVCRVLLKAWGETADVRGFYDTGNLLLDPLTNRPVSIIEEQALAALLPPAVQMELENMEETVGACDDPLWESLHPHFIVFSSVGGHGGTLAAVTLEEMCINRGEQTIYVYHPVVALSRTPFHSKGKYQIILNGKIM